MNIREREGFGAWVIDLKVIIIYEVFEFMRVSSFFRERIWNKELGLRVEF